MTVVDQFTVKVSPTDLRKLLTVCASKLQKTDFPIDPSDNIAGYNGRLYIGQVPAFESPLSMANPEDTAIVFYRLLHPEGIDHPYGIEKVDQNTIGDGNKDRNIELRRLDGAIRFNLMLISGKLYVTVETPYRTLEDYIVELIHALRDELEPDNLVSDTTRKSNDDQTSAAPSKKRTLQRKGNRVFYGPDDKTIRRYELFQSIRQRNPKYTKTQVADAASKLDPEGHTYHYYHVRNVYESMQNYYKLRRETDKVKESTWPKPKNH